MSRSRSPLCVLGLAVLLIVAAPASAQDQLSGRWSHSENSQEFIVITVSGSEVSITEATGAGPYTFRYTLGGPARTDRVGTASGEIWTRVSRAEKVNEAIVVNTTTTRPTGGSSESMRMYFIARSNELTVASLGGTLASGGKLMTLNTVQYLRAP